MATYIAEAANLGLGSFEQRGIEFVPLQQLVEFGAVALGKLGSLRHVAGGDLEQPRQVVALKLLARLLERREFGLLVLNRLLHQRGRNQRRVAQRRRLLDHVVELAYVARPGGAYQQLERLGRDAIDGLVVLLGERRQKIVREQRNVLAALGQRRQLERDDI